MKKSKRQFDVVESGFLNEMMQQSVHITATLDGLCDQKGVQIDELEMPCSIRAELAYDLCSAVQHMYEKLVQQELLLTGNKTNQYTLH